MRGWFLIGFSMAATSVLAECRAPERGAAEVGGRSAFATATRSGDDRGQPFCIRVMYNEVPLSLYGEVYIEGNATTCEGTERLVVDRIVLAYRYRGEKLRTKECSGTHQCETSERFHRGMKTLECTAVTASLGGWSATAATAPGCL